VDLILASTSPYRADLLARFRLAFLQIDPGYDERAVEGESPTAMCRRLARAKAAAVAAQSPRSPWLIVGSDQVAHRDGQPFGKPGDFRGAFDQLTACSGRWVTFETGLALLSSEGGEDIRSEAFEIKFRDLSAEQITAYLNLDRPFDCASSIKAEGLGITLIEDTLGRDINTLLGLPLMLLQDMLAEHGIDVLNEINNPP